ncbi:MAG: peptidylprolyl isomerase [Clostridia bacterium]|nr:peptidylprolyl isomerase [Clostridia bacterium]
MKRIILAVIAIIITVCTVSCNIIITNNDTATSESGSDEVTGEETQKEYPHSNMELAPLDEIIATSENLSVAVSTFKYFFMDQYSSFINQNYYYLSYFNLNIDENIPLHDQEYTGGQETTTWYQIFLDRAKSQFEQYAKFADIAIKEGMTLDENDKASIEDNLKSIDALAAEYSQTFEEYMAQFMGEGMTRERVKAAIEITQLGYKYYLKLYNTPTYTEEQIEEEYKNGNGKHSLVDYNEVMVSALYDETDSEDQVTAAKNTAKEQAEKIKALVESGKTLAEAYNAVMAESKTEEVTETEAAATESEASTKTGTETEAETEEETKELTDKDVLYTKVEYSSLDRYSFLYDETTVQGQINVTYDDSGNAYIVQCVKLPYKNTDKTVNARHIILSSSDYDTEEEAYAVAQKLVQQINEAQDKKAMFLSLVPEYSSDTGSKTNGGLYQNIIPGAMVTEFNEWCFDEERQVDDVGIILTDYGYHVMYFDGFGEEIWRYDCESSLREADFEKAAEEIYEKVQITYNEDLLDRITK